jgi:hypothetical protein
VASLPVRDDYSKYGNRAWAAAVSKYFLLVVAVLAVVCLPFIGFDLENVIIVIGLATVTFYEFRVCRYFRDHNPNAPSLGYRNQSCFAVGILIYCLYHAFVPEQIPSAYRELMDPDTTGMLQSIVRISYLIIAVVAGGSQFGLAWYYRSAKVQAKA